MSKAPLEEMLKMLIAKPSFGNRITPRDLFAAIALHALMMRTDPPEWGGRDQERTFANLAFDFADEAMSIRESRYYSDFSCSGEA